MAIRKELKADLAVVGSGLSGLSTIYFLDTLSGGKHNFKTVVISKSSLGFGTSTYYSAGAFRCPVGEYSKEDYISEVLESGRYINRRSLVELMADHAVNSITALEGLGLKFKVARGMLRVYSNDPLFPGKELIEALRKYVLRRGNTTILDNTHVLDVVRGSDGSLYTICLTMSGDYVVVNSKVVVLATGGAANVFARSDNPQQLTCDGHGICLRLGLPLIDMEFIQFFPLGIAESGKPSFMIPFSKGRLVNRLGEDLIVRYGFESLGKAIVYHRDALSRSMMYEVAIGNGVEGALLLYPEEVQDDLSSFALELKKKLGLGTPIKVLPTAHFSMGGVEVDDNLNTSIEGLYAVGELVGGIHGANRLGGNALTSCTVTAMKVAKNILEYLTGKFNNPLSISIDNQIISQVTREYSPRDGIYASEVFKNEVRNIMWTYVGILRNEESIRRCINKLNNIYENIDKVRIRNRSDIIKYSELKNLLLTSLAISHSALLRTESRGSHFRTDYPEESVGWKKNIRITYKEGNFKYQIVMN
ncbi:MAG: FAD-binding protein [Sulfolobales archaeon]